MITERMSDADSQLLEDVAESVVAAITPPPPPTPRSMRENLPRLAEYVAEMVAAGEMSSTEASDLMKGYVGILVDMEIRSAFQTIIGSTGSAKPRAGFLASMTMKFRHTL